MTLVDLRKPEKGIMKIVCGEEMAMANLKVEINGWKLPEMPMYVPLTGIMLHRKEQRRRLEMSSETHCHASSPTSLGLLANTEVVVVGTTEDSNTSDNGDSGLGGTGTWSLFCMRIQTAPWNLGQAGSLRRGAKEELQ